MKVTNTKTKFFIYNWILFCGLLLSQLVFYAATAQNFPNHIRIDANNHSQSRLIQLGANKSMVIEINKSVRDVLISNPDVADAVVRTPHKVYILAGANVGQTNIFLFGSKGKQLATIDLSVVFDTKELTNALKRLIPSGNIHISSVGRSIVLSGSVTSAIDGKRAGDIAREYIGTNGTILNMLGAQSKNQVLLKVTIAEVQRQAVKQLGVDLTALGSFANGIAYSLVSDNPFGTGAALSNSIASLSSKNDNFTNSSQLRYLKRNGILQTLAEPSLTAVSGESAHFLVGGEFPVPVGAKDGNVSITFKKFGVELNFTPVVLSPSRISLQIQTAVSSLSNIGGISVAGVTVPGLQSRRAETTVELPSGGSIVIAGLIQDDIKKSITGVPGLMDLPILGKLFKSKDFERQQTELAIFVTPYLVKSTAARQLTKPLKSITYDHDTTNHFLNMLNKKYSGTGRPATGFYHGQYGFIYK